MPSQSLKEDGRPATLWYWDDWFASFDIRACSLAARGLWIDMLGIMARSEIKGALLVGGRQINGKVLAKICNTTEEEIMPLLSELKDNRVFSILEDGTITNRRMYSESRLSQARSDAGKKGAEARWQHDGQEEENIDGKTITPVEYEDEDDMNIKKRGVGGIDALFEKWWERYPNKQDKGKAKEKWLHLVKVGNVDSKHLEDALTGYINCIKSKQTAPEYIKMAKTFLYPGKPDKGIPGTWEEFLPYADEKPKPPVGTNIKPSSSREVEYQKARAEFIKEYGDDKDKLAEFSQEWWDKQ